MGKGKIQEAKIEAAGTRDATLIDWRERDHELGLHRPSWGDRLPPSWHPVSSPARHFTRTLHISDTPAVPISESLVRFLSVPIYGINRKADYTIEFPQRPNMHTLRILTNANHDVTLAPITRVFVLHNGLNEARNLRFYYRLASWILKEDEYCGHRSACLIAPFPGHLMHAPFSGPFGQTPLARYLGDSGELFRQFLRYMVEMRWLLSLLAGRRPEAWRVGGTLLKGSGLAEGMLSEWSSLRATSGRVWEDRRMEVLDHKAEQRLLGATVDKSMVQSIVDVIAHVLGLSKQPRRATPVHVVGYSLGGFLAQSVFFAWPNIVTSCSTICSGGAIRALSPTAFAHHEEWQAVLHTLRPEIEASMLGLRIAHSGLGHIAGMAEDQFGYYQRIFDQVFLQEDNASYKARLSEYGTRMVFVSGGEDPIVRTHEILDASPDEGITMLSVANLTHFLGERPFSDRETGQREFWLPEAGGLIGRAARHAEDLQADERREAHRAYLTAKKSNPSSGSGSSTRPERPRHRDLASPEFEGGLDWVIDGVRSHEEASSKLGEGWLFVCRNQVPAAFLGTEMHRAWGTGLHHHDVSIQKYAAGLARRAEVLEKIDDRTTLLLPAGLKRTFVESSSGLVDPHSDAPGYLTTEGERDEAWRGFIDLWGLCVKWLHAGPIGESISSFSEATAFTRAIGKWQRVPPGHLPVAHLPDVWISLDNRRFSSGEPTEAAARLLQMVADVVAGELPASPQPPGRGKAKGDPGKALEGDLRDGRIRIVRVSGAELNPRYRGRFEQAFWPSVTLLAHCAAALVRSSDTADPIPQDAFGDK